MILKGTKTYLRPITQDDVNEKYLGWLQDPVVMSGLATSGYTLEMLGKYVQLKIDDQTCHFYAICDVNNDMHIGNIKLDFYDEKAQVIELGLLIGEKDYWNKGIGMEACSLILDFGFDIQDYRKVWLAVYENNPAAKKLYEKLGFHLEGTLIKHIAVEGNYYDKYIMGLFKEEWQRRL